MDIFNVLALMLGCFAGTYVTLKIVTRNPRAIYGFDPELVRRATYHNDRWEEELDYLIRTEKDPTEKALFNQKKVEWLCKQIGLRLRADARLAEIGKPFELTDNEFSSEYDRDHGLFLVMTEEEREVYEEDINNRRQHAHDPENFPYPISA